MMLKNWSVRKRFACWVILSLLVCTFWLIYPFPLLLFTPARPTYLLFLTPLALLLAFLMGLFRRDALGVLMGVIGVSLVLPVIFPFLMVTVGCFVTVALGMHGECL